MLTNKIIRLKVLGIFNHQKCQNRQFWNVWGHDTLEDKAARKKAYADKQVIKWEDTTVKSLAEKRQVFYAPARIMAEEEALNTGYSWERFNLTDWYTFMRYRYNAIYTDQHFYFCEK
jgi:hypothetical protein